MIAAAVGLLGIVVFLVLRRDPHAADTDPSAHPTAESVDVTINVTPQATVFFDDARVGTSPYHATFERDGLTHRVRAEAPWYGPRTELIVLDKPTVQLDLVLARGNLLGVTQPFPSAPKPSASTGSAPSVRKP
jgi:hypothetical protein